MKKILEQENIHFYEEKKLIGFKKNVEFLDSHMKLILKNNKKYEICQLYGCGKMQPKHELFQNKSSLN